MKASPMEGIGQEGEDDQVDTHKRSSFKYRGSWEPGTSKLGFSIDPHSAVGVGKQIPA